MTIQYAAVRVREDSYRIDRTGPAPIGVVAFVVLQRDRLGNPAGWRVRPQTCSRASSRRLWTHPAAALASMKFMSLSRARELLLAATREAGQ